LGVLYLTAASALAGLPPFGTTLGKSLCEHAIGSTWGSALFLVISALTGTVIATILQRRSRSGKGTLTAHTPSRISHTRRTLCSADGLALSFRCITGM
jgi:formate hydrogenlyase subunit 3/multisubunit Na+/H+ antiporter MnhD subunit